MRLPWFKRIGILFLPIRLPGFILLFVLVSLAVYFFVDIDSRSHSVSDTLINFFFYLLIIWGVYSIVAYLTCRKS